MSEVAPRSIDLGLSNPCRYPEVRLRSLRPWLDRLLEAVAPSHEGLGVRFVSDREMRRLNRDYRGMDRPTDVLSFPGTEGPEGRYLGDIVISVPTVRRQAASFGHGSEMEMKTLLLHGVLHCLGYDHETDDGTMERLENRLRQQWITPDD